MMVTALCRQSSTHRFTPSPPRPLMPSPQRILHVIDPGSPGGGGCTLRLMAGPVNRLTSAHHDVLILGTRRHVNLARRCGIEPAGVIPLSEPFPMAARHALRRWISAFEKRGGSYDIIHTWTARSAWLVSLAAPGHRRLGTLTVGPVSNIITNMMKMTLERHPMPLLAGSEAVEFEYRSLGLPMRQTSLLPAAVQHDALNGPAREAWRERWGVDQDDFVVGLMSEPANWADARLATDILSRLRVSGRPVRLVMHHLAHRRVEAEQWARRLGTHEMLLLDDAVAEPWRIVRGLDAALLIGGELNAMDLSESGHPWSIFTGGGRRLRPMPGVMPVMWAMAGGVPVVSEKAASVRDLIEDGVTGLLVEQHDANESCNRLARLCDDRTVAGRIGSAAAKRIRDDFHISGYCVRLKQAYDLHMRGRPVRVVAEEDDPIIERFEEATQSWSSS